MSKSKKTAKNVSKKPKNVAPKKLTKKAQPKKAAQIETPVEQSDAVNNNAFKEPALDGTETPFIFTSHASFPSSVNDQITDAVTQFVHKAKHSICKSYRKVKCWISSLSI